MTKGWDRTGSIFKYLIYGFARVYKYVGFEYAKEIERAKAGGRDARPYTFRVRIAVYDRTKIVADVIG